MSLKATETTDASIKKSEIEGTAIIDDTDVAHSAVVATVGVYIYSTISSKTVGSVHRTKIKLGVKCIRRRCLAAEIVDRTRLTRKLLSRGVRQIACVRRMRPSLKV